MKKFLSVFLVLIVLFSFSLSSFASDVYIPKTVELEYDAKLHQFKVPEGVDIYVGDSIKYNPYQVNFKNLIKAPDYVSSVCPANIDIYINGVKTTRIWYAKYVVFNDEKFSDLGSFVINSNRSLEVPGHVEFKISSYLTNYNDLREPDQFYFYSCSPERVLIEFDLKDPATAPHNVVYGSVFHSILIMLSNLVSTVITYPLLLVFVVLSLVGLSVGIFCRFNKK